VPAPTCALSASARFWIATLPLFCSSIRPTTSASRAASSSTILARWRWNSAALLAPRQSLAVLLGGHLLTPSSSVVKKFSTFALATRTLPPTGAGAAVRGLARTKAGVTVGWILYAPASRLEEVVRP
jgi:hypothetical protein